MVRYSKHKIVFFFILIILDSYILTGAINFHSLGIAFTGLHEVTEPLYPMICSTAAKTEMSLGVMKREFMSMQDRCRATIIRSLTNERQIEELQLPKSLKVKNPES